MEKQQQQQRQERIKRSIIDIFIGYIKIHGKISNIVISRKLPMVSLDKGLKW